MKQSKNKNIESTINLFYYFQAMELKILKSKLILPQQKKILLRKRVNEKIAQISDKKLIVLEAGAGYGKTSALTSFLENCEAKHTWFKISKMEKDCWLFMRYLARGIQKEYTRFFDEKVAKHYLSLGFSAVYSYFVSELDEKVKTPCYIALDDFHKVNDAPLVIEFIRFLLENSNENIHFLITTRAELDLPISRLISLGQALIITEKELKFTTEETRRLFKGLEKDLSETSGFQAALEETQGWAAGLRLLHHYYFETGDKNRTKTPQPGEASTAVSIETLIDTSTSLFSNYLQETVFYRLTKERQEFLIKSSILKFLNATVCNKILGFQQSIQVLEDLRKHHIFITRIDPDRHVYAYHNLFKDFLRRELNNRFSKAQIKSLHLKAATALVDSSKWEQAVFHFHHAGAYEPVLELLRQFGEKYIYQGHSGMIQAFIDKIPENIANQDPYLVLNQALIHELNGNIQEAGLLISNAQRLFDNLNDRAGINECTRRLTTYLFHSGDMIGSEKQLKKLIQLNACDKILMFDALAMLCFAKSYQTDFKTSEQYLKRAQKQLSEITSLTDSKVLLEKLSLHKLFYYQHKGDFLEAKKLSADSISFLRIRLTFFQQQSWTHYHLGEFKKGIKSAEDGLLLLKENNFKDAFLETWCNIGISVNLTGLGKTRTALEKLKACTTVFEKMNFNWGISFTYLISGMIALKNQEYENVEKCCSHALDKIRGMGLVIVESILTVLWIKSDILSRRIKAAKKRLTAIEKKNPADFLTRAHVSAVKSLILVKTGQGSAAINTLDDFLTVCRSQQYDVNEIFPYDLFLILKYSGNKSIQASEPYLFLKQYFTKNEDKKQSLRIDCFGKFRVHTPNYSIPDKSWNNKKAKTLFQFLILNRHKGFIKKEILMELLWPDEDPSKSSKRLHVTLAALRKILQPEIKKGIPSDYIKSSKASYCIDPGKDAVINIEQFSSLAKNYSKAHSPEEFKKMAAQCLEIYKGDLFSEDPFASWCESHREHYRTRYLEFLKHAMDFYFKLSDYKNAVTFASAYLENEPFDETVYQDLMKLYAKIGRSDMIRNTFEKCDSLIKSELNCSLQHDTIRLYTELMETFSSPN